MKKKQIYSHKCDWCKRELTLNGVDTDSYVVTAEYKYFCIIQTPGKAAERDCMTDYLRNINEKKEEKTKNIRPKEQQKEEPTKEQKEEKKITKEKFLSKYDNYFRELKYSHVKNGHLL